MHRLTGRIPTTAGAVIITVGGLFVGILVAQIVVRALAFEGGGALALELVILFGIAGGVYAALPDRFFTPWNGFFDKTDEVEPWIEPKDRDDGRWKPDDPRHDQAAGKRNDPRSDPRDDA